MNDPTSKRDPAVPALANDAAAEPLVPLELRVNGDRVAVAVRPSRTLLELLRYDLDLIGTKQGCDKGDCGACTVIIDGVAQLSCLTLAHHAALRDVRTVEGLPGPPHLDALLDAFDRCGAGQCGFCTPGMLMSATALLEGDPRPSRAAIQGAIAGNLCRCTGYGAIVAAVELAAKIRNGEEPAWSGVPAARDLPPPLPLPKERPT
jgi:carbon-monoxide dehydrogenase small subunit